MLIALRRPRRDVAAGPGDASWSTGGGRRVRGRRPGSAAAASGHHRAAAAVGGGELLRGGRGRGGPVLALVLVGSMQ